MLRASRPLTVWLLWLAIVLLPVRGWAATMPAAGGPMNPAAVAMAQGMQALHAMQATQVDPAESGQDQPCHAASGARGGASTCSLCDVCHGAAALALGLPPRLVSLPADRPPIEPVPAIERPVLDGPVRPPCLLLA